MVKIHQSSPNSKLLLIINMLSFRKKEKLYKYLISNLFILLNIITIYGKNPQNETPNIKKMRSYEENLSAITQKINQNLTEKQHDNLTYLYSEKAALLYTLTNYKEALDNYILAHQYSDKNKDEYNYYSILYGMALIKQQLQEYKESKELLVECKAYFEDHIKDENFKKGLVNTVGRLAYLNLIEKNVPAAKHYNELEYAFIVDSTDYYYAVKNNGLIEHYSKNYSQSNSLLDKSLKYIKNDTSWNMITNQYIAENYYYLGQKEVAKQYYEKVVSMYLKERILSNEIRLSFERLIEYYKAQDDPKNQLLYIDYLLEFDQEFNEANKFLAKSYYQDYETKNLVEEKNHIIKDIRFKNTIYIIAIIIVFLVIGTIAYLYYRKQNLYLKGKLNELDNYIIKSKKERKPKKVTYKKPVNIPINTELEDKIIDFENEKGFLDPNITLESLAKDLKTNRTTLSQHINQSRDKTFKNYINELRINYIIELIVNDPKTKDYTMDTLAEMAGFNNRKTFSDCFIQITGLRPSYFIKNTRHL